MATLVSPQWPSFTDDANTLTIAVTVPTAPRDDANGLSSVPAADVSRLNEFFTNQAGLVGQSVNLLGALPRAGDGIIGLGEMEITSCAIAQQFGMSIVGEGSSALGTSPLMALLASLSFRHYSGGSASYQLLHSICRQNTADNTQNICNRNETAFIVSGDPAFPLRLAMYYNQSTHQIGFTSSLTGDLGYIDSMDVAMTSTGGTHTPDPPVAWSSSTPEITGFTIYPRVWADTPGADIQPLSATIYKHAADWTCAYPAGTTDTCLNIKS